ncbi:hypothetical protein PY32053_02442 [Paracoccus yeei]|uniref:Uncharacterized protein n=1 Tax=Paracoccus yeei TaxID=147645 RepID=A0A386UPL8_9RHOB|nr:hypothetical protein PY32053_02442 [Paracoccus yeei]
MGHGDPSCLRHRSDRFCWWPGLPLGSPRLYWPRLGTAYRTSG